MSNEHSPLNEAQHERRTELLGRIADEVAAFGSEVHVVGSHANGAGDFLSDLDIWIENPDDTHDQAVANRYKMFGKVGRCLLTWERPRFAPVGGIHTVVMYGETGVSIPLEVNAFQANSTSTRSTYRPFVLPTPNGWRYGQLSTLPWQEGEDPTDCESKLNHVLLVSYWAIKAMYRGGGALDNLEWVESRYEQVRRLVPELPKLAAEQSAPLEQVLGVMDNIADVTDSERTFEVIQRLRCAAKLALNDVGIRDESFVRERHALS